MAYGFFLQVGSDWMFKWCEVIGQDLPASRASMTDVGPFATVAEAVQQPAEGRLEYREELQAI